MKKAVKWVTVGLIFAALFIFVRNGSTMQALRLSDGRIIGFQQMVDEVKQSRLVFFGENHDQKEDHEAQLQAIRALHGTGSDVAIGMEMFTAESQKDLDRWVTGKLPLEDMIRLYYRDWNMPWNLYRDILLYARNNRIPLIGLNLPRALSRKVAHEGFSALTKAERQQVPSGVSCNIDPAYKEFIRRAYAVHGTSDKSFVYFCEAHMLWNKTMGWHLQEFLARNPRKTVVVLAGAGHVMKSGIPEQVFQDSRYSYKVVLPELPDLGRSTASIEDADYLVLFSHQHFGN